MAKTATLPPADATPVAATGSENRSLATPPASSTQLSESILRTKAFLQSDIAKNSNFIACKPDGDFSLIELMEENNMAGEKFGFADLPKAKMPLGGATKFTIESITGEELAASIEGVLVFYGKAGVLWGSEQSKEGSKPVLKTEDLIDAVQVSDDFGDLDQAAIDECFTHQDEAGRNHYDWRKLPYNQWGSGKNGGKRCKEQRLLCILRKDDVAPVFLRVPPSSVTNVSSFLRKLMIQARKPIYQSIVKLSLEAAENSQGTSYAKVVIAGAGFVSKEEGEFFKAMYTDALGSAMQQAVEEADEVIDEDAVVA